MTRYFSEYVDKPVDVQTRRDKQGITSGQFQFLMDSSTSMDGALQTPSNHPAKKVRIELVDRVHLTNNIQTIQDSLLSPQTPVLNSDKITDSQDDIPISSNCTFFHKDKHQTNYFLSEYGQLYIQPLIYQQRYLLNALLLGYKMVLMTIERMSPSDNEHINPDRYYMMLGIIINFKQYYEF